MKSAAGFVHPGLQISTVARNSLWEAPGIVAGAKPSARVQLVDLDPRSYERRDKNASLLGNLCRMAGVLTVTSGLLAAPRNTESAKRGPGRRGRDRRARGQAVQPGAKSSTLL